jgi:hypothetical protein
MRESVNRSKARLAAHGFSHRVDYSYAFSPVLTLNTLWTTLAVMPSRGMYAHSADIQIAFLDADLYDEIFNSSLLASCASSKAYMAFNKFF